MLANNFVGTFSILHGYTSGGPSFLTPEPDGDYLVQIQYMGYVGSAPAAGSTVVGPYTTGPGGFVMTQGTDPAGTCQLNWSYTIIRIPPEALYYSYLPTIPSTVTNPLTGTENFSVGVTLVPVGTNCLPVAIDIPAQTVIEAGAPYTNWWSIVLQNGGAFQSQLGNLVLSWDTFVSTPLNDPFGSTGELCGLLNPGTHNVVISHIAGQGNIVVDGGIRAYGPDSPSYPGPGTQQTPIYIGEHSDTTLPLTTATLRNLKIGNTLKQAVTIEQDAGPQAGNTELPFLETK